MRKLACPALKDHCPSKMEDMVIELDRENHAHYREHTFIHQVPSEASRDYNCKYVIRSHHSLVQQEPEEEKGFIFVQIETYGFDDDVFLIAQPHANYIDHISNQNSLTKVYRSRWGNKFYFPAERDIFVTFAPVGNADGSSTKSPIGKIKIRTWYTKQIMQESIDDVLYTLVAPRPVGTPQVPLNDATENGHSEIIPPSDNGD